ncbi:uncharacterized protein LOC116923680 [Daphnia magna]|uniref:Uncharacterized protein n=1 Tax=Daphnia magna TaxID=35525 RepID=A0A164WHM5_9CRUS|nr:uncharacterized protein LOC116923680 [Daphnia magna]KZS13271.1 Uncharacterized protein APZ42_021750 [Daphnia magna]
MKITWMLVVLYVFIQPVWLQQLGVLHSNIQNGENSFLNQYHALPITDQCIGNCSSQLNSPNFVNNSEIPPVQQEMEGSSGGVFGFIFSTLSSILNYVYRIFVQPWIGMLGYSRSASVDKNFYTVEGRSAVDPPIAVASSVNWHDMGTTVFQVLSSLLGNTQARPSKLPQSFSSKDASTDSTGPISAINPL